MLIRPPAPPKPSRMKEKPTAGIIGLCQGSALSHPSAPVPPRSRPAISTEALTVFTISASVEIAGRLRGGTGALGWLKALPWHNPMMLAVGFSFILLGFGGAGGLINMSYQLDFAVHNTQWITGHFHLIFAGAIVIMYFMIAYDLWPQLTDCRRLPPALVRAQLWLWFVGMMLLSLPWHLVGLLGMPRRMAYYDYSHP